MKQYLKLFSLLALAALASCKPNDIDDDNPPPGGAYQRGVWVLNEGLFGAGNSSVDFYKKESNEREENVFQRVNARPLGDVLQSMTLYQERYYAVVNNSQKIEVMDAKDLKSLGAIEGLTSPRYMLPISADKAYVSDFYGRGIHVINPSTFSATGRIDFNSGADTTFHDWTEQMIRVGDRVFVCMPKKEALVVVDAITDKIIKDTIRLLAEPQWIVKDKNGKLWVLCNAYNRSSHLFSIDPAIGKVEKRFDFPSPVTSAMRLCMNGARDELYYIYKDVYRMDITAADLPSQPLILANNRQFYGLGVDPDNGDVYIGDAVDFTQKGNVYRHKSDGTLLHTVPAGNLPMDFLFVK